MGKLVLTLITGRTAKQGTGISKGKSGPDYRDAIGVIELNPSDMMQLGLRDGDQVRVSAEFGSTDVVCRGAGLPTGLAFMALGPTCNRLIGYETHASGMPDSKNVRIEVTALKQV